MSELQAVPAEPVASEDRSKEQQGQSNWPLPGQEGFVHPDGTPQSVRQFSDNEQARIDREKVGLYGQGAPATGGLPEDKDNPVKTPADHPLIAEPDKAGGRQVFADSTVTGAEGKQLRTTEDSTPTRKRDSSKDNGSE